MHDILLLGAGKIGEAIATLLHGCGEYRVTVADCDPASLERLARTGINTRALDVQDAPGLQAAISGREAVISALSFHHSAPVAQAALRGGASFFDLTEDVATTRAIRRIAAAAAPGQIFMPQCGLAPGFICILAHAMCQRFDEVEKVKMRVGALPRYPSNMMLYNLTWSTDGLINEYCNPCEVIRDGRRCEVLPLEGLESFSLDGVEYEAFNTSGGLGTLCGSLEGRVRNLNYKTVRYRGHRHLMAFLIKSLNLGRRRELLREILEDAVPMTRQDVVLVFCTVSGMQDGRLVQESDTRKLYPRRLHGTEWSAIQSVTAAGVCAALDLHMQSPGGRTGFVCQEDLDLDGFLANRFGRIFQEQEHADDAAAAADH